jgi:hypothetical protein
VPAAHPPPWLEYVFYAQVIYSVLGTALGLSFSALGIGMLGFVAAACALSTGRYSIAITRSVAIPVACGVSFVAIQMLVHGSDLDNSYVRDWIPWLVGVVALQHLAMRRGFLHRAAIVMFLLGLATLPYVESFGTEQRTGLTRTITIANPNDFGAWFGFCCVYFATLGLEVRRLWVRVLAWSLAVAALIILGMSGSRGPLFAAALSVVFALRRLLNRGFLPLLGLASAAWIAFVLGLFDRPAALYAERGLEDTGRLQAWPLAIARVLEFPAAGVGADHVLIELPATGSTVTPHNTLIFIALASGLVPLLLFVAYCAQLVRSAFSASSAADPETPFHRVLLLYTFLIAMNLNVVFMLPWAMATFASVSVGGIVANARRHAIRARSRTTLEAPSAAAATAAGPRL